MINLEEHEVVRQDIEYAPLDIAKAAIAEAYSSNKIDDAMEMIKKAVNEMNESVNEAFKND